MIEKMAALEGENNMTDLQMQFLVWLITTLADRCKDMDELHQLNRRLRYMAGFPMKTEETI